MTHTCTCRLDPSVVAAAIVEAGLKVEQARFQRVDGLDERPVDGHLVDPVTMPLGEVQLLAEGTHDRELFRNGPHGSQKRVSAGLRHDDSSSVGPDAATSGDVPPTVEAPTDTARVDSSAGRVGVQGEDL